MIQYESFQFATAPRTGAAWFIKACQLAGLGPGFHHQAVTPFTESTPTQLRVSLVRHPCDWLDSLYHSAQCHKHVGPFHCADTGCRRSKPFAEFVDYYLHYHQGAIGRVLLSYEADSYLKCEDFPVAFTELAELVGVDIKLLSNPFFHNRPAAMETQKIRQLTMTNTYRRIMESERELVERFDYY